MNKDTIPLCSNHAIKHVNHMIYEEKSRITGIVTSNYGGQTVPATTNGWVDRPVIKEKKNTLRVQTRFLLNCKININE